MAIKDKILELYERHEGRYGYRRITAALRHIKAVVINHKVVQRLMRALGLKSLVRVKKYKSYGGAVGTIAPDVLQRQFEADQPNQKWVTDVTEFKVNSQKLYLSTVMDLSNREIIAWQMSRRPVLQLVTGMLGKALARLNPSEKPLLHSDQGWHYQHARYQKMLADRGIVQSMSRKGNCLDNAAMESFFGILKSEFFHLKCFESIEQLETGIEAYIHYYNHERIKLKLNGLSPVQYRTQVLAA